LIDEPELRMAGNAYILKQSAIIRNDRRNKNKNVLKIWALVCADEAQPRSVVVDA